MSTPSLILFCDVCRLCLVKQGVDNVFENIDLLNDIYLCTGLKVTNQDNYPSKICLDCLEVVSNAKKLRDLATANDIHLKSMFQETLSVSPKIDTSELNKSQTQFTNISSNSNEEPSHYYIIPVDPNVESSKEPNENTNLTATKITVRKDLYTSGCTVETEDEYCDDELDSKRLNTKWNRKIERIQENEKNSCKKIKMLENILLYPMGKQYSEDNRNDKTDEILTEHCQAVQEDLISISGREKSKSKSILEQNTTGFCTYCKENVSNISDHFSPHHPDEIEVIEDGLMSDKDPKIKGQALTGKLPNAGNHDTKVIGDSSTVPTKHGDHETIRPLYYTYCKFCLHKFTSSTFLNHLIKCNKNMLPPHRSNTACVSNELRDKVLSHLDSSKISKVIEKDPLIMAYGRELLKIEKEQQQIYFKLKDLATLLICMRKRDSTIDSLSDAIQPEKYHTFIDCIKEIPIRDDESTGTINITSLPEQLRLSILICIDILNAIDTSSTESAEDIELYKKGLNDFKGLIKLNWHWDKPSNAEKSPENIIIKKENGISVNDDDSTKEFLYVEALQGEDVVQTTVKNRRYKSDKGKAGQTTSRKWSAEEIHVVKKHFQTYIDKKMCPGRIKCSEVINKEPVLKNRTWAQLNTYVNKIYRRKTSF